MTPFTVKVVTIIKNIPEGKVMTYGQIASLADSPRAARQVVRILHSMSKKHRLPWHRVVNAKGEISINDDAAYQDQVLSLKTENIYVNQVGRVSLEKYQWVPSNNEIKDLFKVYNT